MENTQEKVLEFLELNKLPEIKSEEIITSKDTKLEEAFKNYLENNNIDAKTYIEAWNSFSEELDMTELDEDTQLKVMGYRANLKMLRRICKLSLGIEDIPEVK